MFRIVAHQFGQPKDVLTYEPAAPPGLGTADVLVHMRVSTINPSDLIPVTGAYKHRTALPFVPGFDGMGVIAEVGRGVDPAMVGRRVLPLGSGGNWQTWKAVPAEWCIEVPEDLSEDQAATAYVNPLTARLMVQKLTLRAGDRIGITAGASTIGRMLIRLLAAEGAQPVAIVRSSASRDALRHEPAEVVAEDVSLPELTAGLDAVGGRAAENMAAAIRPGGLLVHYGLLSGEPLPSASPAISGITVRLFRLRDWVHTVPRDTLRVAMDETFAAIRTGDVSSSIAGRYPLTAFQDALARNADPGRQGKIILQLSANKALGS